MRRGELAAPVGIEVSAVITARFDRHLSRPNTWRMGEERGTIDARLRVASAPEVSLTVRLRFRGGKAPGLVHLRPIDETTFASEAVVLDERLPFRLELILLDSPEDAAVILRSL